MTLPIRSVMLATIIVLAGFSRAASQGTPTTSRTPATASGEIRGRVVSGAGSTPISFATVDVADSGAATAAARGSTGDDGSFRVQGLRPGRYRVRVVAIGYTPLDLPTIRITSASPSVDVGTVALTASAIAVQGIEVTGQEQDVRLAPDRNTFVVRTMPATRGGSALDVLRNVPAVDVDIDNNVSLRGNSDVTIQVNGRPSPMKPAQLSAFLAQLSADMVDKVEIIPNPSARDDPTGVAGIINIVLKQKADAGTSGGLTIGGSTIGHVDIGGNVGYQREPLSLYGSYGFFRDDVLRIDSIYRENTYLAPITYLEEAGNRTQLRWGHTLTGSAGYQLGRQDELTLEGLVTLRTERESYGLLYRNLDASRVLTGLSDRVSNADNHRYNLEAALGQKHVFAEKGHKLSSELRISGDHESGPVSIVARTLALDATPVGTPALESQTNLEYPDEISLKVDYARPLSSVLRLETGYKGSLQRFHTALGTQVLDTTQGIYLPDSSQISDFTYDQLVNAGYGMLSAQAGKFQLQGGVRIEHATTQFHLKTLGATYDNAYNSVFPSGLIAYNVDDKHQVKLSYSTRIRRPDDTDLLDPTRHFTDPLNVSQGNPYLKPEYIRAVELGLQRTGERMTIQLTPFYRRTLDAVRTLRTIDSAGVSTRTFANISTSDAYGGDVTIAMHGGRLSGFAGASAFRQVSNAANLASDLSVNTFGWRTRMNLSYRVSRTLDVQTLLSYQAAMDVEQGRNASRTQFSLAARQKLRADRMSLTVRLVDPFNTSRESNTTIDPRFYQVTDRARRIRGLLLSLNWTFGKPPKESRRPIDPDEGGS